MLTYLKYLHKDPVFVPTEDTDGPDGMFGLTRGANLHHLLQHWQQAPTEKWQFVIRSRTMCHARFYNFYY